jgi:hypothetical protein
VAGKGNWRQSQYRTHHQQSPIYSYLPDQIVRFQFADIWPLTPSMQRDRGQWPRMKTGLEKHDQARSNAARCLPQNQEFWRHLASFAPAA